MKYAWLYIFGFTLLGIIAMGASPAGAASAAGPYYATPSWDQKLDCTTKANCPRFIVLSNWNNDAVLDRETGLVCEQSPTSFDLNHLYSWSRAVRYCVDQSTGGRLGWRLPTIQEMYSLIDPTLPPWPGNADIKLPPGHPFNLGELSVAYSWYWSATTSMENTSEAYAVKFLRGSGEPISKNQGFNVWCVRGGQGMGLQ